MQSSLKDLIIQQQYNSYNHNFFNKPEYLIPGKINNDTWELIGSNYMLLYETVRDPQSYVCFIYNLLVYGKSKIYDTDTLFNIYFRFANIENNKLKECSSFIKQIIEKNIVYRINKDENKFDPQDKSIGIYFKILKDTQELDPFTVEYIYTFIKNHIIINYTSSINNIGGNVIIGTIIDTIRRKFELNFYVDKYKNAYGNRNGAFELILKSITLFNIYGEKDTVEYVWKFFINIIHNNNSVLQNFSNNIFTRFMQNLMFSGNINLIKYYIPLIHNELTNVYPQTRFNNSSSLFSIYDSKIIVFEIEINSDDYINVYVNHLITIINQLINNKIDNIEFIIRLKVGNEFNNDNHLINHYVNDTNNFINKFIFNVPSDIDDNDIPILRNQFIDNINKEYNLNLPYNIYEKYNT